MIKYLVNPIIIYGGCFAMMLLAFCRCISVNDSVDASMAMQEPLFGMQCKIMEYGTIGFLSKNGSKYKLTYFNYSVNLSEKTVSCKEIEEITVEYESELAHSFSWFTSETLRKREKGTWKEKYFKCFSDEFLDMSNEDKIVLLKSLSKIKGK